jgi:prepilin-type N-terminal cleavage/methylation domain-containing protein
LSPGIGLQTNRASTTVFELYSQHHIASLFRSGSTTFSFPSHCNINAALQSNDYYHSIPVRASKKLKGFTLLEMVVVLAIIATIAGVALPNFARMIESYQQKSTLGSVTSELSGLSFRAFSSAAPLTLSAESARTLVPSLPMDWQLRVDPPISIQVNGFCAGGDATISAKNGVAWQVKLVPPLCAAELR